MFFSFRQNNSGGIFHITDDVSIFVIIEADDYKEANVIALSKGLYFDGFRDCSCCGNRWDENQGYDNGDTVPSVHGKPLEECYAFSIRKTEHSVIVYYQDGRKEYWEAYMHNSKARYDKKHKYRKLDK
jgi:hypothetical protein